MIIAIDIDDCVCNTWQADIPALFIWLGRNDVFKKQFLSSQSMPTLDDLSKSDIKNLIALGAKLKKNGKNDILANAIDITLNQGKHSNDMPKLIGLNASDTHDYQMWQKDLIMDGKLVMTAKKGVKEAIENLRKKGCSVSFVTSRVHEWWRGDATKYAIEWLVKNEIPFDDVVANTSDKGKWCQQASKDPKIERKREIIRQIYTSKNLVLNNIYRPLNNDIMLIEDNFKYAKGANEKNIRSFTIKMLHNEHYSHKLNTPFTDWVDFGKKFNEVFSTKKRTYAQAPLVKK